MKEFLNDTVFQSMIKDPKKKTENEGKKNFPKGMWEMSVLNNTKSDFLLSL